MFDCGGGGERKGGVEKNGDRLIRRRDEKLWKRKIRKNKKRGGVGGGCRKLGRNDNL